MFNVRSQLTPNREQDDTTCAKTVRWIGRETIRRPSHRSVRRWSSQT